MTEGHFTNTKQYEHFAFNTTLATFYEAPIRKDESNGQ